MPRRQHTARSSVQRLLSTLLLRALLLPPAAVGGTRPAQWYDEEGPAPPGGAGTHCDGIQDALPFLNKSTSILPLIVRERRACLLVKVDVPEAKCASWHPLWECHPESVHGCLCTQSTACHGISDVLEPIKHVGLLCRPDRRGEMCTCHGFQACGTGSGGGWDCHEDGGAAALPPYAPTGKSRAEQDFEAATLGNATTRCRCQARWPAYTLRLSEKEQQDVLRGNPLKPLQSVRPKESSTGVARKLMTRVEHKSDHVHVEIVDQGDEDGAEQEDHPAAAVPAASKGGGSKEGEHASSDLVEHCIVTDGWPKFTRRHWSVMLAMLAPLWLATVGVLLMRWRNGRSPQQSATSGGGGSGGRPAEEFGAEAEGEVSEVDSPVVVPSETTRRPPAAAYYLIVSLLVLLKLNLTVVVSSSHLIIDKHSGSADLALDDEGGGREQGDPVSGLLIAAEPLGGLLGILLVARSGLGRPRGAFLAGCLLVLLGSLGFHAALRRGSVALMLAVRALSGVGEGCVFLGQAYLAFLSSSDVRTEVFAVCEFGTAFGLAAGPVITSVANFENSLAVVAGLSLLLLLAMALAFPASEALGAEQVADRESKLPCWRMDGDMDDRKWVAASVSWLSAAARPMLRLAWESSAVMVLSSHFCLGYEITGYLIAAVIAIYLVCQAVFVRFCTRVGDHALVRRCECLELLGLVLMLRQPGTLHHVMKTDVRDTWSAFSHIGRFVLASGALYSGNCLLAAPMNAWSTKHGPRKPCVLLYNNVAVQVGAFVGSYLSRLFAGWDPHQNTLALLIIPLVLSHGLLSESGFSTMRWLQGHRSAMAPVTAA